MAVNFDCAECQNIVNKAVNKEGMKVIQQVVGHNAKTVTITGKKTVDVQVKLNCEGSSEKVKKACKTNKVTVTGEKIEVKSHSGRCESEVKKEVRRMNPVERLDLDFKAKKVTVTSKKKVKGKNRFKQVDVDRNYKVTVTGEEIKVKVNCEECNKTVRRVVEGMICVYQVVVDRKDKTVTVTGKKMVTREVKLDCERCKRKGRKAAANNVNVANHINLVVHKDPPRPPARDAGDAVCIGLLKILKMLSKCLCAIVV